jgi:hypothetical protein
MYNVAAFPLYWPTEHPRATRRREARFLLDFSTARTKLLHELDLLRARAVVLSSNVPVRRDGLPGAPDREPVDPGVAVYFTRKEHSYVIACDQFSRVRWNLRAIGATIEALRSIERNGTTSMLEQAFSGFAQLPPPPKDWREIFGLPLNYTPDKDALQALYLTLVKKHHPDLGGDSARMAEINAAYADALRALG